MAENEKKNADSKDCEEELKGLKKDYDELKTAKEKLETEKEKLETENTKLREVKEQKIKVMNKLICWGTFSIAIFFLTAVWGSVVIRNGSSTLYLFLFLMIIAVSLIVKIVVISRMLVKMWSGNEEE